MLRPEALALELLEYKVRHPSAVSELDPGPTSPGALYSFLLERTRFLEDAERQRLDGLAETLGRLQKRSAAAEPSFEALELDFGGPAENPGAPAGPDFELDFGRTLSEAEERERATLKRLADRVWRDELSVTLNRLAASYRAEKQRHTMRLIYALLRNLARYRGAEDFAADVNLARFRVSEPLPKVNDPLVSLTDVSLVSELLGELVALVFDLKSPGSLYRELELAPDQALIYLRRMALAVARDPYAGELGAFASKGPTSKSLRVALEELSREAMPEETKRFLRLDLEARLQETLAFERSQKNLHQEDVQNYLRAAEALFSSLAQHLPKRVGGLAAEPELPGGVLLADNAALKIDAVPYGATSLTLRLARPLGFALAGIDVALRQESGQWLLDLPRLELKQPLTERVEVQLEARTLLVYREGDYAHLKINDASKSLPALLAEARLALTLLDATTDSLGLSLVCTATGTPQAEPLTTVKRALRRLYAICAKAPDKRAALENFILGAARVLRCELPPSFLGTLTTRLYTAMAAAGTPLDAVLADFAGADVSVYALGNEPLSVSVAGVPLTLRRFSAKDVGESLVVMMPGHPLGSFSDYLLAPLAGGTLLAARSGKEVALAFWPRESVAL